MMNQSALVTGASSGIGLDLARLLARDRHDLILVARSESRLREIGDELEREYGISVAVIRADLSRTNAAEGIIATLQGRTVDILVNNAGYGLSGPFAETDLTKELEMIQVNVVALTHLTKLLLPPMLERRRGRILNVASTAAFQPGPLMAVYYATKAYVLSFTEALAEEVRNSGVTVTVLCPGPTDTGFAAVANMTDSFLFKATRPMSSSEVARAGYAGLLQGKRLVIPGVKNKLLAQSLRVTPRRMITKIVRKMNAS